MSPRPVSMADNMAGREVCFTASDDLGGASVFDVRVPSDDSLPCCSSRRFTSFCWRLACDTFTKWPLRSANVVNAVREKRNLDDNSWNGSPRPSVVGC